MNISDRNKLHHAYLQTIFSFKTEGRLIEIIPIRENLDLKFFNLANRIETWTVLTSDNPFSETTADEVNLRCRLVLSDKLNARGFVNYPCVGQDCERKWPAEHGFFIANISLAEAKALGTTYRQNAIVFGDTSGDAEIVWLT